MNLSCQNPLAIPGASMKVKFDDLEVLQACDIDQNLYFLYTFFTEGPPFKFQFLRA